MQNRSAEICCFHYTVVVQFKHYIFITYSLVTEAIENNYYLIIY